MTDGLIKQLIKKMLNVNDEMRLTLE